MAILCLLYSREIHVAARSFDPAEYLQLLSRLVRLLFDLGFGKVDNAESR